MGSGTDIWDFSDQFHFYQFALEGDVTIEVLVNSFEKVDHEWQKAGPMIRESLEANSRHFSLFVTGGGERGEGIASQYRVGTGSESSHVGVQVNSKPVWLRIKKVGHQFTSSYKLYGGTAWTDVTVINLPFHATTFYGGIAVSSHDSNTLAMLNVGRLNMFDPSGMSLAVCECPMASPTTSDPPSKSPSKVCTVVFLFCG